MANQEYLVFVQALAKDLEAGEIDIPSLPAVVWKIRKLLDDDNSDFEKISKAVSVDSALASRIFVLANSAFYNRSGEKIASLDTAISKLGLDLVKNIAVALVIRQLTRAQEQSQIAQAVADIWTRGLRLSSMAHAMALQHRELNNETASMCGLLHDVGKLYIISKANDTPGLLAGAESISHIIDAWYSQVGRCIVEAWGFPDDVVETMVPGDFLDEYTQRAPKMVDLVYVAGLLIDGNDEHLQEILALPASQKLRLDEEALPVIIRAYKEKLSIARQALA